MSIVHVWVMHNTFVNIYKCILADMINYCRYMQASEMEMEKLLPAIRFSRLATGAMALSPIRDHLTGKIDVYKIIPTKSDHISTYC